MEYKVYNFNNYRIHTIKTYKFKNCSMEVMFTKKDIYLNLVKNALKQ